jgi:hypothetical protein
MTMPTKQEDVVKIKSIISEELPEVSEERIKKLFTRINVESGELSDNSSYKISTRMLRLIYESPKKLSCFLWFFTALLIIITIIHHILFWCIIISVLSAPFLVPFKLWCIGIPAQVYAINLLTTNMPCIFTKTENKLRALLSWPEMRTFFEHFYLQPIQNFLDKRKDNEETI